MKKRLAVLLTAALAAVMLGGCRSGESTTVLKDIEVGKYVSLGEYKGLVVSMDKVEVDAARLDALVNQIYGTSVTPENGGIMDRAVAEGDTVNIDYVGKRDDVAFDNGSATGDLLTIGSNSFIDGFEDGLIGVMPGDTVELSLTFPEGYQNAELAGQAVVFTVTVNFIVPEMKDEIIAAFGAEGFSNQEELRRYATDYLVEMTRQANGTTRDNYVLEAFMQSCTFKKLPQNLVKMYGENIRSSVEQAAAGMGVDVDTYTNYYYKTDFETFVSSYADESARQNLALQAVANAENLNITDEELDEKLAEYANRAKAASVEEYIGENPKEDYREYFMFERVMEFLTENAVITES